VMQATGHWLRDDTAAQRNPMATRGDTDVSLFWNTWSRDS